MKSKRPCFSHPRHQRGISLFEMLLSVSLLGIILSLAMPLFGAPHEAYADIKAKRNAQELVSEFQTAQAAGVNFIVANDLAATLANIARGQAATSGAFKGRYYGLQSISVEELPAAARFLKLSGGSLLMR